MTDMITWSSQRNVTSVEGVPVTSTPVAGPVRWEMMALGLLVIATAFGNILLCVAVITDRQLQNMTNYFLTSLAVADLLVAIVVMPLAVVVQIYDGYFPFGEKICIVWVTMDVLMCTASIWHMATLSVDRYCALRFPLRYQRTRTPIFVIAKIAFVWIVSIVICSPLTIAGFVNPLNVYRAGRCAPAVPEFVIYGSIFAFYVPLVLMLVSYALTVKTLTHRVIWRWRERARSYQMDAENDDQSAQADKGQIRKLSANSVTASDTEKNQMVSFTPSQLDGHGRCACDLERHASSTTALNETGFEHPNVNEGAEETRLNQTDDHETLNSESPMSGQTPTKRVGTSNIEDESGLLRSATSKQQNSDYVVDDACPSDRRRPHIDSFHRNHTPSADVTERQNATTLRHASVTTRDKMNKNDKVVSTNNNHSSQTVSAGLRLLGVPRFARVSFATQTRRTKRKATRILGVIFVVFVVLWTPFFVLNILSAVCPRCVQSVEPEVFTVLVWLGWASSFANPIIYTSFSPAFRSAFRRLLTCHCGERRMSLAERRQKQWTSLLRHDRYRTESQSQS